MRIVLTTLKKTLFWSYDRGSWQYDLMCVLILAFIFLGPNLVFKTPQTPSTGRVAAKLELIANEEIGDPGSRQVEQIIADRLAARLGHPVTVSRIEPLTDASGKIAGYKVWTE